MYRDIIHDTEIYQIIMQEGHEKGLQEGAEQQQKQDVESLHRVILAGVQERFPELMEQARKHIQAVSDLSVLYQLVGGMISARSADQVLALLEDLKK